MGPLILVKLASRVLGPTNKLRFKEFILVLLLSTILELGPKFGRFLFGKGK